MTLTYFTRCGTMPDGTYTVTAQAAQTLLWSKRCSSVAQYWHTMFYNRETTFNSAYYYKDSKDLATLLRMDDLNGEKMRTIAERHYTWKHIAEQYEALY